mmetsp:Transcript_1004/g.2350  ORF Transcript_1004/g.2350 Transcript_1004/m.2350 type:complete len:225 (-) Transcript_1004:357-1031(-)
MARASAWCSWVPRRRVPRSARWRRRRSRRPSRAPGTTGCSPPRCRCSSGRAHTTACCCPSSASGSCTPTARSASSTSQTRCSPSATRPPVAGRSSSRCGTRGLYRLAAAAAAAAASAAPQASTAASAAAATTWATTARPARPATRPGRRCTRRRRARLCTRSPRWSCCPWACRCGSRRAASRARSWPSSRRRPPTTWPWPTAPRRSAWRTPRWRWCSRARRRSS